MISASYWLYNEGEWHLHVYNLKLPELFYILIAFGLFSKHILCVCQYNQLKIIKAVFLGTSNTIYRPLILFSHFIYVKIFWQMSFKLEFCCVLPDMSGRMTSFCSIGTTSIIKRAIFKKAMVMEFLKYFLNIIHGPINSSLLIIWLILI